MKKHAIIAVAGLTVGFILGKWIEPLTVKAQTASTVYTVRESGTGIGPVSVPGVVVGFSCFEEPITPTIGTPRCYIAYVK